ncbi:hypothetical protein [Polyangium mundeleinium]|uniref:Lipoprotein n=1 Tax=Polyangium mundeleinium TaxID=2995306 RepID=A0ABT5EPK3_9BACT|nr:hypothetical protein [Polyangium mundeleinium]MDC0743103.1 hypothetical protein [Polyangium mundeleinium]
MKTYLLPLLAASLFSSGCAKPAPEAAAVPEVAPAPAAAPAAAPAPEAAAASATAPASEPASEPPALPEEMRTILGKRAGQKITLTVVHPRHVVLLVQGDKRVLGSNEVALAVDPKEPIAWETTDRQTLETIRGEAFVDLRDDGRFDAATLRPTTLLAAVAEEAEGRHACKAFAAKGAGFSVFCRVESHAVAAARTFGEAPLDRIVNVAAGEHTFFRMELDPGADGVDATVLGYSFGTRGHVVRAEASRLPGEARPTLALLSESRMQPVRMPRFPPPPPHHHHHRLLDSFN